MPIVGSQDPQRGRQRGEIGKQRQHECGGGDDAELAHRRQVRKREREKAAGIDESGEHDRAAGYQQRMSQSAGRRAARAAFLKMVEEMYLVVLGGAQDRRADEDGGDIERDAGRCASPENGKNREQRRNHSHQPCGRAAKHHAERREKSTLAVSAKLWMSVGSRRWVISPESTPLPARRPRTSRRAGSCRLRRAPGALHERAHRAGRAEESHPARGS